MGLVFELRVFCAVVAHIVLDAHLKAGGYKGCSVFDAVEVM